MSNMDRVYLTEEEATTFFANFYFGEHHIPGKVKRWGSGFCVEHSSGMSTFDYNSLTRFVVMCHDNCIRGEIMPSSQRHMKVIIHKRQGRDGEITYRHPELEYHVSKIREGKPA